MISLLITMKKYSEFIKPGNTVCYNGRKVVVDENLVGNGGMMTIIGMPVNYASDSFEGYRGYMEKQQKQLIGQLQEYIEQY